jgi:hypothetical protein
VAVADAKIARSARDDRWRAFDVSRPVLALVVALLAIMIVLPMGWLVVYAFATKDGQATVANFVTLFTDPSFVDPLLTTLLLSVSVSVLLLRRRRAARLAGGAHRHAAVAHRAHPGDGLAGDPAVSSARSPGRCWRRPTPACSTSSGGC